MPEMLVCSILKNKSANGNFFTWTKAEDFAIAGLDSSEPDINDGQIGVDQLEWLKKELDKIPDDMCKIVTFHHHLLANTTNRT